MILGVVGVWNDPKELDIKSVKKNTKHVPFEYFFDYFQVFDEKKEITVGVTIKPGHITKYEQAVGKCGGNEFKTQLFKVTEIDNSRKANRGWYEMTFNNGTTMSFVELPFQSEEAPTYPEFENTTNAQRGEMGIPVMGITKSGTPLTSSQCASTILVLICCKINIMI